MGMVLTMHCVKPGSGDLMEVNSTDDVLRMFELYRRISDIHVFLGASEIDSGDVGDNVKFDEGCDFSVDDERKCGSHNGNTISACEMVASNFGGGGQENNDVLSDYQSNDDFDFISNSDSDDECDDINREALRDYITEEGFEIVRDKNEKARVTAHCLGEGCLWRIHASPLPDGVTYKIKTFQSEHTCVRATKNTNATSVWIAKKLVKRLRANLTMKIDGIRSEIRETYEIETSKWQLYRARVKARDEIEGNHGKSYNKMHVYAEVVRETNSGSLVKIEYDWLSLNVNPIFKRFFICFEAMKKGFLEGCRPFIGLDGCHLKGPYGGVLLAAIALDGNNGLFLMAFAIVEGETKESEEYEVTEGSARFVVNFDARSCSCRAWEISGLPCKHLAACIARKRANIEDYCDGCYSNETYLKAHGGIVHPLSYESTWPVVVFGTSGGRANLER
ncbi:hypothetical protein HHK36_020076 [Tetracentron sinense]|uniref:SWIM-type domain-containing protein n=1 Tax=Tetracentron sinense TaxID=13715 RepID=A0A834YWP7_TETSI|nr:hypothetical protein HHK36_020076 [Tetracentron sinense]